MVSQVPVPVLVLVPISRVDRVILHSPTCDQLNSCESRSYLKLLSEILGMQFTWRGLRRLMSCLEKSSRWGLPTWSPLRK
ncbi:hypothetical protein EUGRSUZ_H02632 [Eucalyptus grandis]|uniref:Uncharacterized protein n=2 Tax=Eucalyptus grandis TaxID=71139 RepID=A0ACC3JTG3_EUCGR|nr:hypothetical protein EUGRSUZ_H02632 [Eucalyptus grandis]